MRTSEPLEAAARGTPSLWTAIAERLPAGLRGGRLALSRRALLALLVVALAAAVTAAVVLWRARPHPVDLDVAATAVNANAAGPLVSPSEAENRVLADGGHRSGVGRAEASAGSAPQKGAPPPTEVVVDVEGRVAHPGIERLPRGARVVDAVRAAGGALPGTDTSAVNLARPLSDGDEILLGPYGSAVGGVLRGAASAGPGAGTPVDLNTATVAQLETLPGVGPGLAQRIIAWRTDHGPFTDVTQLRRVRGIGGGVRYREIAKLVRV